MSDITNMLDDASEEAIREIKRLRSEVFSLRAEVERLQLDGAEVLVLRAAVERLTAEVERLRLTPEERELLQAIVDAPITIGCCRATIATLLKRQGGGE